MRMKKEFDNKVPKRLFDPGEGGCGKLQNY
jgi:hypothetical protein